MSRRVKNLGVFFGVLAVLDVGLAQVGKLTLDTWYIRGPERKYRISSEVYHHDLARNAEVRATWGGIRYPYRTNNLGFRDGLVRTVPLHSDAWRVVFIGDSFTEGVGVPFEETFVGILAGRLAHRGVEVLNAAVSSYSPAIYYRKTKYLLEDVGLEIDALIVLLDLSDIQDEAQVYRLDGKERVIGAEPPESRSAVKRVKEFLKHNSLLVNAGSRLKLALQRTLERDDPQALGLDAEEALWTIEQEAFSEYGELGLRRARAHMERLLHLVRRDGVALAIVVYPWPDQILHRDLNSRQVTFWKEWAAVNDVAFLDLFPRFIIGGDPRRTIQSYFIPFDSHWNAKGHRLVAEALLDGGLGLLVGAPAGRGPKAEAGPSSSPGAAPAPGSARTRGWPYAAGAERAGRLRNWTVTHSKARQRCSFS